MNKIEKGIETPAVEENSTRKNLLYALQKRDDIDTENSDDFYVESPEDAKNILAYSLVKNVFPNIETGISAPSKIEENPIYAKHLANNKYLNKLHESIKSRILSREEVNYQEIEEDLRNLLEDINNMEREDIIQNTKQEDINDFKRSLNSTIQSILELDLSKDMIDELNRIAKTLQESTEDMHEEYMSCYSMRLGVENILDELRVEFSEDKEMLRMINIIKNNLTSNDYLKTVQFPEELDVILNRRLNEKLQESAEANFGERMGEFIKENSSYKKLWEKISNGEKINKKELKQFSIEFCKFAGVACLLILVSVVISGCDLAEDIDNKYISKTGYDTDGHVINKVGATADGSIETESSTDSSDYSVADHSPKFQYGSTEGRRLLAIKAGIENNGSYSTPEHISSNPKSMVVGVNMKSSIYLDEGVKDKDNVDIFLEYTDQSGNKETVNTEYQDVKKIEFNASKPWVKIWFKAKDNRSNIETHLRYDPLPEQKRSFLGWVHDNVFDSPTVD